MRWDQLFDDLEGQLERELTAEEVDLEAEEERLRLGRLSVRDRLVALQEAGESAVSLLLTGGLRVSLRPVTFGRDWFSADLLDGSSRRGQCIVPLDSIAGITLDRQQIAASLHPREASGGHPSLSSRLGLTFVLRDLCRRRRPVDLVLADAVLHGTIDRVGRDHLDLAVHEAGAVRREGSVAEYRVIAFAAITYVKL